jgi:type IV secretion system protein VirB10
MSVTAPAAGNAFLRPWQKIGIWILIALVFVAIFLLFSGRMISFKKREPAAAAAQVQTDVSIPPTIRPVLTDADPPPVRGRAQQTSQRSTDDPDNSPILAYSSHSSAPPAAVAAGDPMGHSPAGSADALETSLQPSSMEGTKVAELPDPRWLIEHGRILPCRQLTRINSTLPGSVSAIIPGEIRGETGDVVLFDAGAKVFGTIQHTLMNGADRLAVLWQDITTPVLYDSHGMPHQFRITVNSPASSLLGETGLDGDVNHHLLQKVGGIIGFSLVQGGIQGGIQELSKSNSGTNSNGTTLNLNSVQSGTDQAIATLLNSWVNIPDVMTRDQGLACAVQVVRDLDMRAAYKLRTTYRSAL